MSAIIGNNERQKRIIRNISEKEYYRISYSNAIDILQSKTNEFKFPVRVSLYAWSDLHSTQLSLESLNWYQLSKYDIV